MVGSGLRSHFGEDVGRGVGGGCILLCLKCMYYLWRSGATCSIAVDMQGDHKMHPDESWVLASPIITTKMHGLWLNPTSAAGIVCVLSLAPIITWW